ncbi:MAG: PaaI family thioesterase [Tenuifilaceae bacterium]
MDKPRSFEIKSQSKGIQLPDDVIPFDLKHVSDSFVSGRQQRYIEIQYFRGSKPENFYAKVLFRKEAQGAPDIVHGGAIAAVFDETMGAICLVLGQPAVTATLTVDYRIPVPVEKEFLVEARLEKTERRKFFITARMLDEQQELFAESKAIYVKTKNDG